jgi:hypothetical protein
MRISGGSSAVGEVSVVMTSPDQDTFWDTWKRRSSAAVARAIG